LPLILFFNLNLFKDYYTTEKERGSRQQSRPQAAILSTPPMPPFFFCLFLHLLLFSVFINPSFGLPFSSQLSFNLNVIVRSLIQQLGHVSSNKDCRGRKQQQWQEESSYMLTNTPLMLGLLGSSFVCLKRLVLGIWRGYYIRKRCRRKRRSFCVMHVVFFCVIYINKFVNFKQGPLFNFPF